jgi:hypothetical protein
MRCGVVVLLELDNVVDLRDFNFSVNQFGQIHSYPLELHSHNLCRGQTLSSLAYHRPSDFYCRFSN